MLLDTLLENSFANRYCNRNETASLIAEDLAVPGGSTIAINIFKFIFRFSFISILVLPLDKKMINSRYYGRQQKSHISLYTSCQAFQKNQCIIVDYVLNIQWYVRQSFGNSCPRTFILFANYFCRYVVMRYASTEQQDIDKIKNVVE